MGVRQEGKRCIWLLAGIDRKICLFINVSTNSSASLLESFEMTFMLWDKTYEDCLNFPLFIIAILLPYFPNITAITNQ